MAYGTAAQVAALVPRYADSNGEFNLATRPVLAHVELWLTQVSGVLDTYLRTKAYSVPVTDTDFANAITLFTVEEVAAIVEGVNGSGRFGPTASGGRAVSRFAIIRQDVIDFIDSLLIGNNVWAGVATVARTDGFTL
jgi:hypothetical protein